MKKVVIEISECWACPHCCVNGIVNPFYTCEKKHRRIPNEEIKDTFPSWCPLENSK